MACSQAWELHSTAQSGLNFLRNSKENQKQGYELLLPQGLSLPWPWRSICLFSLPFPGSFSWRPLQTSPACSDFFVHVHFCSYPPSTLVIETSLSTLQIKMCQYYRQGSLCSGFNLLSSCRFLCLHTVHLDLISNFLLQDISHFKLLLLPRGPVPSTLMSQVLLVIKAAQMSPHPQFSEQRLIWPTLSITDGMNLFSVHLSYFYLSVNIYCI